MTTDNDHELLERLRDTPRLFEILRETNDTGLALQKQLRAQFPDDIVRAALTLQELRGLAGDKFSRADRMWFDRVGFEQSTPETVARHKAQRFTGPVWDYCCGIGSDAIALAGQGDVVSVDLNPAACLRTRWNAEAYDVAARVRVVCADVESLSDRSGLVHIDPDRRAASHRRTLRIEDYRPGLPFLYRLMDEFDGGAIKLGPASNFPGKFADAEVELVSLNGECKEATVWFGRLAGDISHRATVLPTGETLAGNPLDEYAPVELLSQFLYDPDPAVVRAGLIDLLAEQRGFFRLDNGEEYLTSNDLIETPFVRAFEVLAELPNNDRTIRRWFREADIGQVEIKCRHVPIDVEAIRRKLPLTGSQAAVLIYAKIGGKTRAVTCRRVQCSG